MPPLKCLHVFWADGAWFGSEIEWARSGSGWYRQTTSIPVPQSKPDIEAFAAREGYRIVWQGAIPDSAFEPTPQRSDLATTATS